MQKHSFRHRIQRSWQGPGGVREVLIQAVPIIITQSTDTILMFTDRYLLAKSSPEEMAAALSGGLTAFLAITLFFGLLSQVNALAGQFTGRKAHREAAVSAGQGILLTCVFAPLLLLTLPWARHFFEFCGHEGKLLEFEVTYYKILVAGHIITLLRCVFASFFSGIGRPAIVMKSAIVGVILNIPCSYALIFGKWGLPELGIAGAAYATVFASFCVLCILIWQYFSHSLRESHLTHLSLRLDPSIMKKLMRFGLPAGFEFMIQLSGFNFFILLFASAGPVAAAAVTITFSWELLCFLPMTGIQIAVVSLSGKFIGMGKKKLAERATYNALKLAWVYTSCLVITYLIFAEQFCQVFTQDRLTPASELASHMLRIACLYMLFDSLHLVFSGILKGAGDLLYPAILTFIIFWGASALAFIEIRYLHLEPILVWWTFTVLVIGMGLLYFLRFKGGHWRKVNLIH